jgi:hypothetical protein
MLVNGKMSNYTTTVAKIWLLKQACLHGNNGRDVFYAIRAEML